MGFLKRVPIVLVLAACGLAAGEANAQATLGLAAAGPVNPGNGYPQYYQDRTGLALAPCLDITTPGDFCGLLAGGVIPDPTAPIVFPTNFPSEFFYWLAKTTFDLPATAGVLPAAVGPAKGAALTGTLTVKPTAVPLAGGPGGGGGGGGGGGCGGGGGGGTCAGKVTFILALEGTFPPPVTVQPNKQIVFARFRLRITGGLVPGATYTVTHPYGVQTFLADPAGTINFTDDQGCLGAPCDFNSVLSTTNAGPFLAWDSSAPAAPAGFLGDPGVN
ncbi:MAG: hypothetical protein J2P50_10935, partial [Hyphomicrobiaceae bacterium]|nr:hypothetical protein [Hyphomicrobiaceae bacterium]